MQYYIFKPAAGTPETGQVFPQVQKMKPGYNYKAHNSVHALSREYQKLPDYEPDLDYFIVHARANLTDLLSVTVTYGGFLISEKLKSIFEQFNLPTHKFYSAKLKHRKQFYNYYWMHIICNLTDVVDYPRSTFFVYHNFSKNLGYVDVSSNEELIQKEQKLKSDNPGKLVPIWAEKIALTPSFDRSLDLFEIGTFNSDCYISESLKQAIINEKITGSSIQPANNLIF